jgi:DNA-binding NtrC family response regulator
MSVSATAGQDPLALLEARPRVLVVDGDAATRRAVEKVLVEASYDVLEASSGDEAVKLLWRTSRRGERIDLILSEIDMTGGHGPSGLGDLLRHEVHPPFILMTTAGGHGVFHDAMRLGADTVLRKPVDLQLLVLAVQVRIPR